MATVSDKNPQDAKDTIQTSGRRSRAGNEDLTQIDHASDPTAISPVSLAPPPASEEIAAEAYAIFEARGGDHGRDEEDWLEAERRLLERRGQGE